MLLLFAGASALALDGVAVMAQPAAGKGDIAVAQGDDISRGVVRAQTLVKLLGSDVLSLNANPRFPPTVLDPLHLDEAVGLALSHNFDVQAAAEKTSGSKWELVGAYGAYLPRIDYTREAGTERSRPSAYEDASGHVVASSTHHTNDRVYSVRQPLIDLTVIADVLMRHQTLDAVHAEELATREKAALDTIASFFRILQARLVVVFAEGYKSHLDQLAARMKDRVEGGGASKVDLDRINARSVTARSAIIEAGSEMEAALVEFRRLTGQMPAKMALPQNLIPPLPKDVDEVLARAMQTNPEYMSATLKEDVARTDTWKAATRLLPKVSFEVTDSRNYNQGGVAYGDPVNGPVYPYSNDRRMMGVLRWTLNGGVDFAQGLANAAHAREAEYRAIDVRTRIEESVRVAFDAMNAANGRITAVTSAVEANSRVAQSFEEQYVAGSRQLLDLLDAYERLYQSQIELARLVISEANAGYLIRRQMGELVSAVLSADQP